ncbi:hypothetical protein WKH57_01280 [Niallia taxi]|uniref:hypothetical protein n=1 Tax=Niallia taxi TaxID=2499688 RepID=UPI00300B5130
MDKMNVFGLIPFDKKSEKDKIVKELKREFGKTVKIRIHMDHVTYEKKQIRQSDIVI